MLAIPANLIFRRGSKLDPVNIAALRLYSTDDLRHLYQSTADDLIRIRHGIITRAELGAEIRRRQRWDRFRRLVLQTVSVVTMLAAVIAAIEGLGY
jgi:hypothetical protein